MSTEINYDLPYPSAAQAWGKGLIMLVSHLLVLSPDDPEVLCIVGVCCSHPKEPMGAGSSLLALLPHPVFVSVVLLPSFPLTFPEFPLPWYIL